MKTISSIKKLIIFGLLLILFSCKKDYTCTCTLDSDGSITNISDYNLTKNDAESACSNANQTEGVTCVLDEK